MSLKSFHIVFIFISTLFSIFFGFWCYREWSLYKDFVYLVYAFVGLSLCVALFVYSKWFLKEVSELNV